MKKIKISDCITQAQPQLEKIVFDANGNEIAKLKMLNMREKTSAIQYAVDKKKSLKATNVEDYIGEINPSDHLLKSLELAIVEWCFEETPSVQWMLEITQLPENNQAHKILNVIITEYNKMLTEWAENQEVIEKN